jgi:hypothetical protein
MLSNRIGQPEDPCPLIHSVGILAARLNRPPAERTLREMRRIAPGTLCLRVAAEVADPPEVPEASEASEAFDVFKAFEAFKASAASEVPEGPKHSPPPGLSRTSVPMSRSGMQQDGPRSYTASGHSSFHNTCAA